MSEEKVKKPKLAKDHPNRQLENYVKSYFSRPFLRRLKYILTGLVQDEHFYIFGNVLDMDSEYSDSRQCTGLVKIHDERIALIIRDWLRSFHITFSTYGFIYIDNIIQIMNKAKWNRDDVVVVLQPNGVITATLKDLKATEDLIKTIVVKEPEESNGDDETSEDGSESEEPSSDAEEAPVLSIVLYRPTDSHFTMIKQNELVENYHRIFFKEEPPFYDVLIEKEEKIIYQTVEGSLIKEMLSLSYNCHTFKLVLFLGHDLISFKHFLPKNPEAETSSTDPLFQYGIRLWNDGHRCLNFGSYFRDAVASIVLSRDNIFIFPRPRGEGHSDDRERRA